jgi:hypothetical protein
MKQTNHDTPEQEVGAGTDIIEQIELADHIVAKEKFNVLRQRLLNVNAWQEMAEGISANFELMDPLGDHKTGQPEVGDHFRISIPGPGTKAGDGHDWVRIEKLEDLSDEAEDSCIMQVRPSANPQTPPSDDDIAHFFNDKATSSFIVRRINNVLRAEVHGRNEQPNTNASSLTDKVRNTIVGIGAIAGFANIQWKKLAKGLLSRM